MTATNTVEFGLSHRPGVVTWPDDDGELYHVGHECYVAATADGTSDSEAVQAKLLDKLPDGWTVYRREVLEPVEVKRATPFPTGLGAVIRAQYSGEETIAVRADTDSIPWRTHEYGWVDESALTILEVISEGVHL